MQNRKGTHRAITGQVFVDPAIHLFDRELIGSDHVYHLTTTTLGKGGYATVYLGYRQDNNEAVAVKQVEVNQEELGLLQAEIDIMKRLLHVNIVQLLDVVYQKQPGSNHIRNVYLILEYCGGGDLKKAMRKAKDVESEQWARFYVRQIAEGLRYLIAHDVAHRDIKPQNLMISADGKRLKIGDFGLAKSISQDALSQTMCGSPLYMAPELLFGKEYTSRADLWSVGVILYEMLFGRHPLALKGPLRSHRDLIAAMRAADIQFPLRFVRRLSGGCLDLLENLLQTNPKARITWDDFFQHPWLALAHPDAQTTISETNGQADSPEKQTEPEEEPDHPLAGSGVRVVKSFRIPRTKPVTIPAQPAARSPRGAAAAETPPLIASPDFTTAFMQHPPFALNIKRGYRVTAKSMPALSNQFAGPRPGPPRRLSAASKASGCVLRRAVTGRGSLLAAKHQSGGTSCPSTVPASQRACMLTSDDNNSDEPSEHTPNSIRNSLREFGSTCMNLLRDSWHNVHTLGS